MVWLNAFSALDDFPTMNYKFLPFVDSLDSRDDYKAYKARMDAKEAKLRDAIEAQLANPPEVWWSPHEIAEPVHAL